MYRASWKAWRDSPRPTECMGFVIGFVINNLPGINKVPGRVKFRIGRRQKEYECVCVLM